MPGAVPKEFDVKREEDIRRAKGAKTQSLHGTRLRGGASRYLGPAR